jgi:hypothetical protein
MISFQVFLEVDRMAAVGPSLGESQAPIDIPAEEE